jgi:membrane protein required for beta-lactamase induction
MDPSLNPTPEQVIDEMWRRVSRINKTRAILAAVFCLFPFVGLILALLGVAYNWPNRGWPRTTSLIALGIGAVSSAVGWVWIAANN